MLETEVGVALVLVCIGLVYLGFRQRPSAPASAPAAAPAAASPAPQLPLKIFFGSQTGTAEVRLSLASAGLVLMLL